MKRLKVDNGYASKVEEKWKKGVEQCTNKKKLTVSQKKKAAEVVQNIWNDWITTLDIQNTNTNIDQPPQDEEAPKRVAELNSQLSSIVERVMKYREEIPKLAEEAVTKQLQEQNQEHILSSSTTDAQAPIDTENATMVEAVLQNIEMNLEEAAGTLRRATQLFSETNAKASKVVETISVLSSAPPTSKR